MEHFLDNVTQAKVNYKSYIKQFEQLLKERSFLNTTLEAIEKGFIFWPLNRGYDSFLDFRASIGIARIVNKCGTSAQVTKEEFAYYLEYMLNILQIPKYCQDQMIYDTNESAILRVLYRVLDEIDCDIIATPQGQKVVFKNGMIEVAKEITQDEYNLDKDLYLFTHSSNKKNLIAKADILCRIYKYLETIAPKAKSYGHNNLWDDIGKLMDGLDIRHAPNKKEKEILNGMKKSEMLEWYDQLFGMSLSLIILTDYSSKRRDVKELKGRLG